MVLPKIQYFFYLFPCKWLNVGIEHCPLVKFADHTGLMGLISNDDDHYYKQETDHFVAWCDFNQLKKIIVYFSNNSAAFDEIVIKGEVRKVELQIFGNNYQ